MGSISVIRCVYLMFLLACISEVGLGNTVFNVMEDGAIADGKTDNSKVIFAQENQDNLESFLRSAALKYINRAIL